jgi:hypothetical protein
MNQKAMGFIPKIVPKNAAVSRTVNSRQSPDETEGFSGLYAQTGLAVTT